MTAIIRELPSGKGFKLSYLFEQKCETVTFYFSGIHGSVLGKQDTGFGGEPRCAILQDDIVMDRKNKLHKILEIVNIQSYSHTDGNELALFRTYQHVKDHISQHSYVREQTLVDKTRFAEITESEANERLARIRGVPGLILAR